MLDDPKAIEKVDRQGMIETLESLPEQCEEALKNASQIRIGYPKPSRIIITGMGGSAIGGDLMRDWLKKDLRVPIEVYRGYELPVYADKKTLVIGVSYSGNTEETLRAFSGAIKKGCMCVGITSGGKLEELCKKNSIPYIKLPGGYLPRFAIAHLFLSMVVVFEKMRLCSDEQHIEREIKDAMQVLEQVRGQCKRQTPAASNISKQIAENVNGKIPIIYTFGPFKGAAKRIKSEFNENAKTPCFWAYIPELNHNEILGWESDLSGKFFVILVRDKKKETKEYVTRLEFTKRVVEKKAGLMELEVVGRTKLAKILSLMYIGAFASVYLAVLKGVDPAPTRLIDELKEELK